MTASKTMRAVVFKGPRDVVVETRPIPELSSPKDALIRVRAAGVCGTELHSYRGEMTPQPGYIMGHEFTGEVVEVGAAVKHFKAGDLVVASFTQQCGECFYCLKGYSSMCEVTTTFGGPALDGGQAEYVRVPYADTTLFRKPDDVEDSVLVMMADIFPTGYYGVKNYIDRITDKKDLETDVVVSVGCGPVGLCAILAAKAMGVKNLYAIDTVPLRLTMAAEYGAIPIDLADGDASILERIHALTDGRGADAVLEIVGSESALRLAFNLVRPLGFISSIGYQHGKIPFTGLDCYMKNARMQFGRCPVRTIFAESLEVFRKVSAQLEGFVDTSIDLEDAANGFALFDQHKVRKVVLIPNMKEA
ncbi:hypothetical protein BABINDRAFT_165682 [Babjeviella inositovora NRRL Y-12698]|uniref:Enoyl reductase (ER) domain-containing protein n=1 Tax=Babjeviella inositovora NRRL Y-12698 TaxID=984486 RepID=A0A1E3QTA8_9ASCO|nr:uncharacterized protein BABINDRAFT_165682 [Babjeviella inositovora NRRL Y-12698]ODQ80943.1 hypothetical protein BABINDRAFT_165682 [Babjeviella inositovora NRRL Y-12698]